MFLLTPKCLLYLCTLLLCFPGFGSPLKCFACGHKYMLAACTHNATKVTCEEFMKHAKPNLLRHPSNEIQVVHTSPSDNRTEPTEMHPPYMCRKHVSANKVVSKTCELNEGPSELGCIHLNDMSELCLCATELCNEGRKTEPGMISALPGNLLTYLIMRLIMTDF